MNFDRTPFIVAEMSCNHLGSLDRALAIVDAAADAGADAVKLQTWDRMCVPGYVIKNGPWAGRELASLYDEACTPWAWHEPIFDRCRERGIIGFSAPFDLRALAFLESIGCPLYKIASFEIVDLPLIRAVSATGKPMMISTGMATWEEIRAANIGDCAFLRCSSAYPAPVSSLNLNTIPDLRKRSGKPVGFSDHTLGHTAAVAAVALGAVIIEKHLTLLRADGGPDAKFSAEPDQFAALVKACRDAHAALGEVRYGPSDAEQSSLQFRRSLWVTEDMRPGDMLTADNLQSLRPAGGIAPRYLPGVLGHPVRVSIPAGTPLTWEMLK